MSNWTCKYFDELSAAEIYEIAKARQKVFIVEQNCPFLDMDDLDYHSWHLYQTDNAGEVIAYLRLMETGGKFTDPSIGRLLTTGEFRGKGMGKKIMAEGISMARAKFPGQVIRIFAQQYLEDFYSSFGFRKVGTPYLEDDILHINMYLSVD